MSIAAPSIPFSEAANALCKLERASRYLFISSSMMASYSINFFNDVELAALLEEKKLPFIPLSAI